MKNRALRRAAILVASLDIDSADALLEQMPPGDAQIVRNAVMDLGEIDITEQQEVIQQFVDNSPVATPPVDSGVEIDPELARRFADPSLLKKQVTWENVVLKSEAVKDSISDSHARPFSCLADVSAEELAELLSLEHPQTTAILVAHLEAARAAQVLSLLGRERQSDTLTRIARLQTPHPEIVRMLEEVLLTRLASRPRRDPIVSDGLVVVESILRHTTEGRRQELEAELFKQDKQLARELQVGAADLQSADILHRTDTNGMGQHDAATHRCPPVSPETGGHSSATDAALQSCHAFDFNDLELLDDAMLAEVMHRCTSSTTLLALAGASDQFVKRIQSQLSRRDAMLLQRKIEQIGPLRLDDILRAQQYLADVAQQVAEEKAQPLPGKQRLSLAA